MSVAARRQPSRRGVQTVSTLVADLQAESGQTMAEYAVVLGVITIAVVVTLRLLSTGIKNTLTNVIAVL
jgi:Flp pilus assembly pilin Flp